MKMALNKPLTLAVISALSLAACKSDPNSPGWEYMPDMYRSPSLETYGENALYPDGMSARLPVDNTIPRGEDNLPYDLPNNYDGYMAAAARLNPVPASEANIAKGKELYDKFCWHCHGKKGEGDGTIPTNSDYPPPPSYTGPLKNLPAGQIFHSITYGKGLMGAHAAQLSKTERWLLVHYVQQLQNPGGKPAELLADTNQVAQ
jgi:mono/diheme cytochrome c family protein